MSYESLAGQIASDLIAKSGVGIDQWTPERQQQVADAASAMAARIIYGIVLGTGSEHMAAELLEKVGTQICFADHAGDFNPAAKTDLRVGTPTEVQLSLASLANDAGRESAKFDFGATRAPAYAIMAAFEFAATPTSAKQVLIYLMPSPQSTAANGNPMQIDGADAAAPSGIGTLAELKAASKLIGVFNTTDDATANVQVAFCGEFSPPTRYGSLLVVDASGAAFHSDDVECHIVFDPIIPESQ